MLLRPLLAQDSHLGTRVGYSTSSPTLLLLLTRVFRNFHRYCFEESVKELKLGRLLAKPRDGSDTTRDDCVVADQQLFEEVQGIVKKTNGGSKTGLSKYLLLEVVFMVDIRYLGDLQGMLAAKPLTNRKQRRAELTTAPVIVDHPRQSRSSPRNLCQ